jgi:hypothetical protein
MLHAHMSDAGDSVARWLCVAVIFHRHGVAGPASVDQCYSLQCVTGLLTYGSAHPPCVLQRCVVNGCKGWQGVGSLLCRAHASDPMAARIAHVHTHIDAYRGQRALFVMPKTSFSFSDLSQLARPL